MAETLLYGLNVLTSLQEMSGIGVTQGMGRKRNVKLCLGKPLLQAGADEGMVNRQVPAELLEYVIHTRILLAVSLEYGERLGTDGYDTILLALALLDVNLQAVKIDVIPLEVTSLEGTQATVVDDGKQSLGVEVTYTKEVHHLLQGQNAWELPLPADLGQGKTCKSRIAHGVQIALESIDEVLELSLRRYRLAAEHRLEVPIDIRLGEFLGQLADMHHRLVDGVTVVSD